MYAVASLNIRFLSDFFKLFACMVIKPFSEFSCSHILLSTNCNLSGVICSVLMLTE